MRGKLSQSILQDLYERDVFLAAMEEDHPAPIMAKLQNDPWPKNMVFDLTPECVVAMAWEAFWQMDQAKDWDTTDPWVRGQITAGQFMLKRMKVLMTEEQLAVFEAKEADLRRPRW